MDDPTFDRIARDEMAHIEHRFDDVDPDLVDVTTADGVLKLELSDGVTVVPVPVPELTEGLGRLLPVMQNTVALGALLHLMRFDVEVTAEILTETFARKGPEIVEQNVKVLRAGYEYAKKEFEPLDCEWSVARKPRSWTHLRKPSGSGKYFGFQV